MVNCIEMSSNLLPDIFSLLKNCLQSVRNSLKQVLDGLKTCKKKNFSIYPKKFTPRSRHESRYLLIGLLWSSIGDLLLNIDLFPIGMAAFGVAQGFYISSFGFRPLQPAIGAFLYIVGALPVTLFYANLPVILKIGLPVYGLLLLTMCWRAIARCFEVLIF